MRNTLTMLVISISLTGIIILSSCSKKEASYEPTQAQIIENKIKAALDSVIANTHVPGLVAGIWAPNEGINLIHTVGVADLGTKEPISPDMIFRIASNTKTFTITVLLQLVDEGMLSLDDKLSDYLPDFPRANEVTIEMLTNMRSGIFNFVSSDEFLPQVLSDPTKTWTADEFIAIAAPHDYYFDPGTGFHYSNTNTAIAGKIIEMVTGSSLEFNIRTRIIDPLHLIYTQYLVGGTQIPGYHSSAYYIGEYNPNIPELSEVFDISFTGAAGAAISTVYELRTYVEALTGGEFLTSVMQQKRLDCLEMGDPHGRKYGLGIFEYKGFYGHNGGVFGYTSLMVNSPDRNCTIIIWYNCQIDESDPTDFLYTIPKLIYPHL